MPITPVLAAAATASQPMSPIRPRRQLPSILNLCRTALGSSFAALLVFAHTAAAQNTVRAWHANGQVFVVWRVDPAAPLTYDVYRSPTPITSTTQGTLAGRVFEPEWQGTRLKLAKNTATWCIPSATGGIYQLAANEGLFVYTPRAAGNEHFAVVRDGNTTVSATNSTAGAVAVGYDPANDPVTCHLQLADVTSRGYPFKTYALWVDGNDDPTNARPDFPVMANAAKRGAPHVFTVYEPKAGLPAGPLPAAICLHGGGGVGSHWSWAPESVHYANTEATPVGGVTVAMDDRLYIATNGVVSEDRPTNWFGWHTGMNPFTNTVPGNNAVVVPYTLRRLVWTLDWLQTRSPYAIDAQRTAVMGCSMGGAGTLLLSRYRPERFAAATAFVPQHYTPDTGQRLFGTPAQNLATNEPGPSGQPLRVNDFFDAAVRLSAAQRDFCFTRIFRGRRDTAVDWDARQLQLFNSMNAGRFGTHLYWDNRDHTASDWTTDDPTTPAVDIGEWVAPVRTSRSGAQYQARFRARQSYPAFFDDDQQPATPGRQPTLGNGTPDDGTPWGTWGGYFDWDVGTIVDQPAGWACTLWLVGQSPVSVDNYPGASAVAGVVVRMPRRFAPTAGAAVQWTLRDDATDAALQSGAVTAAADGLVAVTGLTMPKDPQRVRLELQVGGAPRPGDGNGDGAIDEVDLAAVRAVPVDLDGDGFADAADVDLMERYVRRASAVAAGSAAYGLGCYAQSRSFYELFAPPLFDLAGASLRLSLQPTGGYAVTAAGAYVPPSAAAAVLPLADDGAATVTLASPLTFPGGTTTTLEVCANGFVSAGSGNGTAFTPAAAAWLASPRARWGCWHDFNPSAAASGRVKFEQVGSVSYVTWDGVFSYGTNTAATFQLQFDRASGHVTLAFGAVAVAGNGWLVGFAAPAPNVDPASRNLSATGPLGFATAAVDAPALALAASAPKLGTNATLTTTNLPAGALGSVQVLGLARFDPGIDLAAVGMPGCLQSTDLTVVEVAMASGGAATYVLPVPYDPVLMGLAVHAQSAAFAPGANAAGLVTSNGVTLTVGI
jgi:hypothetical protein